MIRQAIKTKYLSATNTKGSRIKASCERGSKIFPWNYELEISENHLEACEKLKKFFVEEDQKEYGDSSASGWDKPTVCGCFSGEYFHVFSK